MNSPIRPLDFLARLAALALLGAGAAAQKVPDLRIDLGEAAGASLSDFPVPAVAGTKFHVVWVDSRNGQSDIYYSRSLDRGVTWSAAPQRLDTGSAPGSSASTKPRIQAAGNAVYVIWLDEQNGQSDVYFNRSLDAGATWLAAPIRLDTGSAPGAAAGDLPNLALNGNKLAAVWQDARNGLTDVYVNRSLDQGTTWLASDVRMDVGSPPGAALSADSVIAYTGSTIIASWEDWRDGGVGIYVNRSHDDGATFLTASDIRLDSGPTTEGWSRDPKIAVQGNSAYVTWYDNRNDTVDPIYWDIYFNRSLDLGDTWLATDVRVDSGVPAGGAGSHSVKPVIAANGSIVVVSWPDTRNDADGLPPYKFDIYANRSINGGLSWDGEQRLDTGDAPGANDSSSVDIALSGTDVYVVWQDQRSGKVDAFLSASHDLGISWAPTDRRLDTGDVPGAFASRYPRISASASDVLVTWYDERSGLADIYVNQPFAYASQPGGKAGSGGFVPGLAGLVSSGHAVIGGKAGFDLTRGLGGSIAGLLFGTGSAPVAFLDVTLGIGPVPSFDFTLFALGGAAGVAGAGSGAREFAIPVDAALIGLYFGAQALVYDPGAAGAPVSASNPVGCWIGG
ncbi:MAG: hypothetical protein FJ299_11360 [Planctomycetes bacterium]|nr:hypothetical protein [Planctomycetota bacterium]